MSTRARRPARTPAPARSALPAVSRSLSIQLLRSRESVMRHFRPHLRRLGLTEQQWRVLRVLRETGPAEAGRLAAEAVLLPPSVSRIVRDLVRKGLLARRPLRDDRRRVALSITPAGTAVLRRGSRDSARAYATIARQFGAAELTLLQAMLDRLEHCLGNGVESAPASAAGSGGGKTAQQDN